MPDDAGTLPNEAAPAAEERSRTLMPQSARQWSVAIASAVLLLLGGGAGGAFVLPTAGDTSRLESIERRLGYLERGTAELRCVSVLGGSVVGECRCKAPDAGVVDLCPPRQ